MLAGAQAFIWPFVPFEEMENQIRISMFLTHDTYTDKQ